MDRREFIGALGALAAVATTNAQPTMPLKTRQGFETHALVYRSDFTSPLPTVEFPRVQRLTQISFPIARKLVGYQFTAAFAATEGSPCGIYLIVGQTGAELSISQDIDIIAPATCPALAAAEEAFAAPTSIFFDEDFCIALPANTPISLYGCNIATVSQAQALTATASLYVE